MTHIDHLMKADKIAKRLKLEKPKTVEDLLIRCGLTLKFLGDGGFREVFKIVGTSLVIKVPIQEEEMRMLGQQYSHTPVVHAKTEWKYRKKVLREKKYEFFRPYMPALHCLIPATGITLSDYYKPLSHASRRFDAEIDQIIGKLAGIGVMDGDVDKTKKDNYGIDRDGKLRIIDLGCFGGELE
jgi:hypothetical protein